MPVDDAGLAAIAKKFPDLDHLTLILTRVTPEGVKAAGFKNPKAVNLQR